MVSRKRDREYIGEDLDDDGYDVDAPFSDEAVHSHSADVDSFDPNASFSSSFSSLQGRMYLQPVKQRRLLSSMASASSSSSLSTVFPFLTPALASTSAPTAAPTAATVSTTDTVPPGTDSLWSTIPPEWQATATLPATTKKKRSWSPDFDGLSGSEQSQTSRGSVLSSDDIRDGVPDGSGPSKRTRLLSSLSKMSLGKAPTSALSSSTSTASAAVTATDAGGPSSASSSSSTVAATSHSSDVVVLTSKYLRVNHVGNTNESLVAMNEYLHQLHLERQLRRQHPPLWSTGHASTTSSHRPLPSASSAHYHAMDEDPSPHEEAMDVPYDHNDDGPHHHSHSHSHNHRNYRSASP